MNQENRTLSFSIVSGKGGVGKTNLALNLAYSLYQASQNTLLVDCDLGLANLDVILGISPQRSLHDLLNNDARAEDIIYHLENHGLGLIPAASGVSDILDLDEDQQMLIIQRLKALLRKYNFLLLDVGAGISRTVRAFAQMTHKQIVVITPEPTSLTDGYALIKVLSTQYKISDFYVLVNMVDSEKDAKLGYDRLRAACAKFLGLEINYLGHVPNDSAVLDSVRKQTPFLKFAPSSHASKSVQSIGEKLIDLRQDSLKLIAKTSPLSIGEVVS